jgi:hypothetical protein
MCENWTGFGSADRLCGKLERLRHAGIRRRNERSPHREPKTTRKLMPPLTNNRSGPRDRK